MKTVLFRIEDNDRRTAILAQVRSRLNPVALERLYPDAGAGMDAAEFFAAFNDGADVQLMASALANQPGVSAVEIPARRRLIGS